MLSMICCSPFISKENFLSLSPQNKLIIVTFFNEKSDLSRNSFTRGIYLEAKNDKRVCQVIFTNNLHRRGIMRWGLSNETPLLLLDLKTNQFYTVKDSYQSINIFVPKCTR